MPSGVAVTSKWSASLACKSGRRCASRGELLPQSGQGAVEAAVGEVRGGGVVGDVANRRPNVAPDEGDDVQFTTFRRGRHDVLPVRVPGRQISKMEWPV
jgi:hypothetical protein